MPSGKGTIVELQALRGVAATVVLLGHAVGYYAMPGWFVRASLVANGYASVVIFFVLSGFVLARSLQNETPNMANVTAFYIRRLFRLYPAIFAASALALLYLLFLDKTIPVTNVSPWLRARFDTHGLPFALLVTGSFSGVLAFLVPPVWSIFVEIFGSMLMPFVAFLLERKRMTFWALAAGLAVLSVTIGRYTPHGVAMYMIDFLAGASILVVPVRAAERFAQSRSKYVILVVAVLVLLLDRVIHPFDERDPLAHTIELAAAWTIVAGLVHGGFRAHLLKSKPLTMLGDVSYSLYLVHFPVMCILAKVVAVAGIDGPPTSMTALLTALTLVASLVIALAGYRFVERPGMRAGKAIANRWMREWAGGTVSDAA